MISAEKDKRTSWWHSEPCLLAGLAVAALGLRLFCYWLEPVISRDGVHYVMGAEAWARLGDFRLFQEYWRNEINPIGVWTAPLFSWLLVLGLKCGIPAVGMGVTISMIAGALMPLLVWKMLRTLGAGDMLCWAGAILMAVHPGMVVLSTQVQRDALFLFLAGGELLFMLYGIRRNLWRDWLIGGIAGGLALLTRYEALELLALAFGWFAVAMILWPEVRKKTLCGALAWGGGFFGTALILASIIASPQECVALYMQYYSRYLGG